METFYNINEIMNLLVVVIGLSLNIAAFFIVINAKCSPSNIFLLNLTISDLICLTFLAVLLFSCTPSTVLFLCPINSFVYYSSIYGSTLFLTALSVDRYLGVAFPIKYKLYRKPRYAVIGSIVIWVCAMTNCSVVLVIAMKWKPNVTESNCFSDCYTHFTKEQLLIVLPFRLELCIMLFFIPLLISIFCYSNFVKIVWSSPYIPRERKQRAVGLALTTLFTFIVCFSPYNISHIIGFFSSKNVQWRNIVITMAMYNTCFDPIVFYFSSTAIQKSLKRFCRRSIQTRNSYRVNIEIIITR
ncbi:free fatty acid receptor 2-like [Callorhinchus milii]|uniref:free fatty acid receptor 2-like n=1 Tax=Callorhinchus milii TaxID=7868 RepID=UPI00045718E6|nr:free fatty acid receptor 2-like [Callorhinchus milii]|eukprot:gi/632939659/ref/XP_007882700.1/ PREDICTED: free fatty acid receptor 2-like [Callorhinchus milii]